MTCPKGRTFDHYGTDPAYITGRQVSMLQGIENGAKTQKRGHVVAYDMHKHDPKDVFLAHAERFGPSSLEHHRWVIVLRLWRRGPTHTTPDVYFWLVPTRKQAVQDVLKLAVSESAQSAQGMYDIACAARASAAL